MPGAAARDQLARTSAAHFWGGGAPGAGGSVSGAGAPGSAGSNGGSAGNAVGGGGTAGLGGTAASIGGGSAGGGGATPMPSGNATFVAVGYAGRRVRSTDLGVTWTDDQTLGGGGDDVYLLRAVGFGNGVFVAAGYKILTSPNGKDWQEQTNPQNQWLGGLVFQNGSFVAVGGYGYSARSSDGISWTVTGTVGSNQASRSLAYGKGMFVAASDTSTPTADWYQSTNGDSWTKLSGGHANNQIAFCNGAFADYDSCTGAFNARGRATTQGITVRLNNGRLERSTNSTDFTAVSNSPQSLEDVAVGYVP